MFDIFKNGLWDDGVQIVTPEQALESLDAITDIVAQFALYVTILLGLVLLTCFIVMSVRKSLNLGVFKKIALGIVVGYSYAVIALLGFMRFVYEYFDGNINSNFYVYIGLLALIAVLVTTGVILRKTSPRAMKYFIAGCIAAVAIYCIVLVAIMPVSLPCAHPDNAQKTAGTERTYKVGCLCGGMSVTEFCVVLYQVFLVAFGWWLGNVGKSFASDALFLYVRNP